MSNITIKHQKHRAYPIAYSRKLELLKKIVEINHNKTIIIVSANENSVLKEDFSSPKVTVVDDRTLYKDKELIAELLISFDVPAKSIVYISRLSHTKDTAYVLVSKDEEKLIYPVETLLGRAIKQEILEGFEEVKEESGDRKPYEKREFKPRENTKKPYNPKREYSKEDKEKAEQWKKKDKPQNKWLGKDESGKSQFSGKSGERNHRYDGSQKDYMPKKTGRKISIEKINKKED